MSDNGGFADRDGLFGAPLWRVARPGLVIIAAVVPSLYASTAERRLVLGVAMVALLAVLAAIIVIGRRHIVERPARLVFVCELEVGTFVLGIVIALATVVNGVAWLMERYQAKGTAYLITLIAAVAIGYFSRDLFKAVENDNWMARHYRARVVRLYKPYFYRRDPATGKYDGNAELARWRPDGLAANALRMNQYRNERDEYVVGWGHAQRRQRSMTIESQLSCLPWNPNPNVDTRLVDVIDRDAPQLARPNQ